VWGDRLGITAKLVAVGLLESGRPDAAQGLTTAKTVAKSAWSATRRRNKSVARRSTGLDYSSDIADLAVLAETVGYVRVWIFDSAPLWEDPFVHLALAAERTARIGLAPLRRHQVHTHA
jgi:hypothetical protein